MHPYFSITPQQIQSLDDEQARELVAHLCKAELADVPGGVSTVTWGGDQRAKDDGVDVKVALPTIRLNGGYVPRSATIFQVKAEKFSASKIPDEMAPKGEIRDSIRDLGEARGAYIIVSTRDNCTEPSLRAR